jgi:hypothetical protein
MNCPTCDREIDITLPLLLERQSGLDAGRAEASELITACNTLLSRYRPDPNSCGGFSNQIKVIAFKEDVVAIELALERMHDEKPNTVPVPY